MEQEVVPYTFTMQQKHTMYTEMQSRILTKNPAEKLKIPSDLPNIAILRKELTELQIKPTKNGAYLLFAAPDGRGKFDDFAAVLAVYCDMVGRSAGFARNQRSLSERFPGEKKEEELPALIETREMKTRHTKDVFRQGAGDY
jgi:hypothetical protein